MYHMKSTCTLKLITSENKHNKLFEKLRESEEAQGGGGVQTHKNFIYCSRPFQLIPKERTLGGRLKYSSFIYLFIYFTM